MKLIYTPTHLIQMHIIDVLRGQKHARFRDMRPINADSNLYSYHLKILQKQGFVDKTTMGYELGLAGLAYVFQTCGGADNDSQQPKVTLMLLVQNSDGDVLIKINQQQPFIERWSLPSDDIDSADMSLLASARRVAHETFGIQVMSPRHAGDCYIRVIGGGKPIMSSLVHVVRFETDDIAASEGLFWARPHKLQNYDFAPAIEQIITRAFFNDPYFFEEYSEQLRL